MSKFSTIIYWYVISIGIGTLFNGLWAIIFWNNDDLFMYHWLGVPIGMCVMAYGGIKSLNQ